MKPRPPARASQGVLAGTLAVTGAVLLLLSPSPAAAAAATPGRFVTAWIPHWDQEAATARVVAAAGSVHAASPFWFQARSARTIASTPGAGSPRVLRRLRAAGIAVIPTVASSFSAAYAARHLARASWRRQHVAALVDLVRRGGFAGIDLDYETIALTTSPRLALRVRAGFSSLVRDLCTALRRLGRQCVVTVMPRLGDAPVVWRGKLIPAVYDYAAISRHADRMRVMAYDQHAPNTRPGPIAGLPWVQAVVRYTLRRADPGRVELGIPLYGRTWSPSGVATHTWASAVAQRRRVGAELRWDARQAAPFYRHGGRTTWYSSARSTAVRAALARASGFAGVALWAPGEEDPATWAAIRSRWAAVAAPRARRRPRRA